MIEIKEIIYPNSTDIENPRCNVYILFDSENSIVVHIDIPKWLYNFYRSIQLCIINMDDNISKFISNDFLSTLPSSDQKRFYFYSHGDDVECSDCYWVHKIQSSSDNLLISRSVLNEQIIKKRIEKLLKFYFKVNNKETHNEVDWDFINEISIEPKYPTDELKEIVSKPYPPTGEIFIDGTHMIYNKLMYFIGKLNKKEFKENQTMGYQPNKLKLKRRGLFSGFKNTDRDNSIEPKHSTINDLVEPLRRTTKPKSETLYIFTQDPDLDKLVEKIINVLKQITIRNDLSEETYKIKSIPRDIDILISSYLEVNIEDRKNKKLELQKALESMLNTVLNYYKMIKDISVSELNAELKFIEHKYK